VDLLALDVSYVPWFIPTERRMRVVFKKATVGMRIMAGLSDLDKGERAEKPVPVTVKP